MAAKKIAEQQRMKKIVQILKKEYPDSKCSLIYKNPFQLLVATVLSAQCTDERVNQVVPVLFRSFDTPEKLSKASLKEIEAIIRSTGFFKNKALSLKSLSSDLLKKHQGKVPSEQTQLVELRGVGRKTANVVLGTVFGVPSMVVDTHVGRISRRLGFTKQKDPVKVEFALMDLVQKKDWVIYTHLLIDHGRKICSARRKPLCDQCVIATHCPKVDVL